MDKRRILFVRVHNSVRSQMAEAFLKKYGGDRFDVESAGLEPGKGERPRWGFPDPSSFAGTHDGKLKKTKEFRDQIEAKIKGWIESIA